EEFFNMFVDLTPQEQQAVTERLEYTKNCLLARKNQDWTRRQATRDDSRVNSNANISMQMQPAPQLLPPSDVEMDVEQSTTVTSVVTADCTQTIKNGSVFFIGIGYSIGLLKLID
ncbi:UNVERIFIED_CONTAM: hypothetical protein K2H54_057690, partial [Gekko kuhli]